MTGRVLLEFCWGSCGSSLFADVVALWRCAVAVADPPFFQERLLTGIPLNARIHREMIKEAR